MNTLSRYSFVSNFNTEKMTKQEAMEKGVSTVDFAKCDTDGDGSLNIDEILANQDVCDKLLKAIQSKISKISGEEAGLKAEQAELQNETQKQFSLAA